MLHVLIGFTPWILFWSASGAGHWPLAILGALAAALASVALRYQRTRTVMAMEAASLAYFALHAGLTLGCGSSLLKLYGPISNNLALAAMALGSLLWGAPFTYQYAKQDWDPSYWEDPGFIRINQVITGAWAAIFAGNALLGALALLAWPGRHTLLLTVILPNLGLAAGIAFSATFPGYATGKAIQARLDAWDPYHWPAPSFAPLAAAQEGLEVIVVGSGLGGLAAAALLAKRGLRVAVFEQHVLAGGFCTSWARPSRGQAGTEPYVFDAGVHDVSGLGERGGVRSLLRMLDLEGAIQWHRNEHEYHIGGQQLKVAQDPEAFIQQLGQRFPAEAQAIQAFFQEMRLVYQELFAQMEQTGGAPRPPAKAEDLLAFPRTCPHAYRWMDTPFRAMLDSYLGDPGLKELLGALTGYLGDAPDSLTVGAMAPIFGFYFDGGYYPAGGSQALPNALKAFIEAHQGTVHLGCPVRRILIEQGRAVAIEGADGQIHRAQAIISNADAQRTFLELVGPEHLPGPFQQRLKALQPSASAFQVFLGLDFIPDLGTITLLEGMAIMNPSRIDPALAPPGHAALTLLALVPQAETAHWDREAPDYQRRKREFGDRMLARLEAIRPGLGQHITYRQDASPATCARYAWTTRGSIYGPAAGQARLTISTPIQNLFLAGSCITGSGVEAAIIAGIHAANAILPTGPAA